MNGAYTWRAWIVWKSIDRIEVDACAVKHPSLAFLNHPEEATPRELGHNLADDADRDWAKPLPHVAVLIQPIAVLFMGMCVR